MKQRRQDEGRKKTITDQRVTSLRENLGPRDREVNTAGPKIEIFPVKDIFSRVISCLFYGSLLWFCTVVIGRGHYRRIMPKNKQITARVKSATDANHITKHT